MKKIFLLFLSILVIVSLIGCTVPSEPVAELTPTPFVTPLPTLEPTTEPTKQPAPEITVTPAATVTPTAEPAPEATVEPTAVPTSEATKKPTAKPTATPTTNPTVQPTATPSATKKPTVVQRADPETGISWDGVSPIIYTYSDGTTGTEKRLGAKYEAYPGVIYTIDEYDMRTPAPAPSPTYNPYCSRCGKIMGNGLNGTCISYWSGGDHTCYNCGENIPSRSCHTCKSGCQYCKKPLGNGTNGTCYRDYFSSSKCPSCNVSVPINTCHSCK